MSNNIYDILKKINSLEQPKSVITESAKGCKVCGMKNCKCEDKKHESKKKDKKDKGAIAEAVAKVEQQLNEKYMGFKKSVAAIRAKHDKMDEGEYQEDVLTPKQKAFAKLAPPPDKITYADKIAGAKKGQKDEGNEFSGALAKAKAQHKDKFTVGGKTYPVKEGFPTVADAKKRMDDREGKTSHGKKTVTKSGVKHERDYDAVDKGADVDTAPKGRGRPKKDKFVK